MEPLSTEHMIRVKNSYLIDGLKPIVSLFGCTKNIIVRMECEIGDKNAKLILMNGDKTQVFRIEIEVDFFKC